MGFTIPNAAGLTYADQSAPDTADFAIIAAGDAGYNVASGCAVTATGSSLVLTVASGAVRFANAAVTVAGNTATVTTANATNPRYDLLVVDATGVASIIAGTAAAAPAFPAFTATTQVVLAAVYVPATATTLATANLVDKRWVLPAVPGIEIDSAERFNVFDLTAIGTTETEVDGLRIVVPPQLRPFEVTFESTCLANPGTAATGTVQAAIVKLHDVTAGTPGSSYGLGGKAFIQGAVTNQTMYEHIRMVRRFAPNSATRTFSVYAFTVQGNPSGWAATNLYGADPPTSDIYSPMLLKAVSL